jgi:REP element-mobilizing transposase RayT
MSNNIPLFITIVVKRRFPLFELTEATKIFADELLKAENIHGFDVLSFVIMPEHMHILLIPRNINISEIMRRYKSITYHLLAARFDIKERFWQRSFDSREKRTTQEIYIALKYIKENPMKKQLAEQYSEYPYYYVNKRKIENFLE